MKTNLLKFILAFVITTILLFFASCWINKTRGRFVCRPKLYNDLLVSPLSDEDGYNFASDGSDLLQIRRSQDTIIVDIKRNGETPITYHFADDNSVSIEGQNWKYNDSEGVFMKTEKDADL